MSDHLKKRLRDLGDHCSFAPQIYHVAADCIEELERENARLDAGWQEANVRALDAGLKLHKAVEVLQDMAAVAEQEGWDKAITGRQMIIKAARTTLAELEGK